MEYPVYAKEMMFRNLAGNPIARKVAERALHLEDQETAREESGERTYPWPGFEWSDVATSMQQLNQLVIDELLVTGGPRGTFRSNSTTTFKLKDPELVRESLDELANIETGQEEGEMPKDLFDFILGHDDIKEIIMSSLQSEKPVHILLVGPPATSKSMFLGELGRLPFSRYALGGSTRKGGLEDYLLEFRPRYLIIDEIDKMDMKDMSVLLSLMESGVVTRLKKRMRDTEKMTTWVFGGANRDQAIWPELKSRFFTLYLTEYSEADFINIARTVLINREHVDATLSTVIARELARHTRDVREAIHFGRLCHSGNDVARLIRIKYPRKGLL
jgi:Holliday junction DNA helicase RuvB